MVSWLYMKDGGELCQNIYAISAFEDGKHDNKPMS
jgi:hypothetical protein